MGEQKGFGEELVCGLEAVGEEKQMGLRRWGAGACPAREAAGGDAEAGQSVPGGWRRARNA